MHELSAATQLLVLPQSMLRTFHPLHSVKG